MEYNDGFLIAALFGCTSMIILTLSRVAKALEESNRISKNWYDNQFADKQPGFVDYDLLFKNITNKDVCGND